MLVQDFPGAHVSVVLLVDKIGTQMHEKNLEKFGQRLMRWPLETPSREEGETVLEMARAAGVRAIGVQSPFFHPDRFLHEADAHEHAESVAAWVNGYLVAQTR